MTKDIFLLGSTGSIGTTALNILKRDKNYKVKLLTTNSNINKIYKQAITFKVKEIVIFNQKEYLKNIKKFKKKKIKVFSSITEILKFKKKKSHLTINAISGIDGLEPSLNIIKHTKNLAIANKESIICGWKLIKKELLKHKTSFIPLDSEHFSIWSLINNINKKNIEKIYLTASGGPFLNTKLEKIKNIKPKYALKHPNWKMGKKISIDSATMMNKIFEVIEAIKIFNIEPSQIGILIHPKSYIHAIVNFKNGLTKFIAHDTTMEVPIANAIYFNSNKYKYKNNNFDYDKLNGINFIKPNLKKFPLLKILEYKFNHTYLEIIIVSLNDALVKKYLENKIAYITIHNLMLKLLKKAYFYKYYSLKPKNINDIKIMVKMVNLYVDKYVENNG